ncbi:MAG: hypothetical protein LIP08_04855 [Bacteroides sp.]|nr:hypothetical protein [Bacteroides sp.]
MNDLFLNKYRIPSTRASWWDYGQNGFYFVTICTHNQKCYFGEIIESEMQLSPIGQIAWQCWADIPQHFSFVKLDVFVIMPNHIHGIIIIDKEQTLPSEPGNKFQPQSENLASIIRGYKSGVSKQVKHIAIDFKWQARFHDHIIRNDKNYARIANYIINNPIHWTKDKFYKSE